MKLSGNLFLSLCLLFGACGSRTGSDGKSDGIILAGNPVIEGWYADPEVAVYENRYWIFPTYSAPFDEQVFLDAFSSDDLVSWEKHSRIVDTTIVKWVRRALWAPSTIEKDGKYFLFFGANDIQTPESPWWDPLIHTEGEVGGIGIAVASSPEGPYTDYLGKPLINDIINGAQPIDQFVFHDQDGTYYLIYGGWKHCNIGILNDDFTGFIPFESGETFKSITPENYVEGSFMFIRNGKYYFMWSEGNWTGPDYSVAYAISDNPLGPFERIGKILQEDDQIARGAGHHSVLNIPGTDEWYIVYHRRPLNTTNGNHRQVCIDRMFFDEDGLIQPVVMTVDGVEQRLLN
jgi:beta-xylosidase